MPIISWRICDYTNIRVIHLYFTIVYDFNYFTITEENWTWVFVLVLYISIFGTIFELYDLQKSSKLEKIIHKEVEAILCKEIIIQTENKKKGIRDIRSFF